MKIAIADIDMEASKNASRESIDIDSCRNLAASMSELGQLEAVRFRYLPNGKILLIYGFRRRIAALLLGWTHLEGVEDTGSPEDDAVKNITENLLRQDLTLWEECLSIRNSFPEDMSHDDIGRKLGHSRTWVRPRRLLWTLPEEIQLQVQRGELSVSDLQALTQLSPEEQVAKAAMMAEAKAEGQSLRERAPSLRQHARSIKQLRRLQSQLFDSEREDWKALVEFALGDIEEEELFSVLEYEPTV